MRSLYLIAAVVAVVLAFTAPMWLPSKWFDRTIRKHFTPSAGGSFPFYWASSSSEAAASTTTSSAAKAREPSSSSSSDGQEAAPYVVGQCKTFTNAELAEYDGHKDKSKPLLLVVLGEVYDVTSGERFYAAGMGYNGFVGRDNSAAFQTGKFNDTEADIRGLGAQGVQAVVGWRSFFRKHETYKFVGVVEGLYFGAGCRPTSVLSDLQKMVGKAQAGEEEDKRRAKLYPRCNMHYDGIKKETVVWCDGYQSEQDMKTKAAKDSELRVLRMVKFTMQANGEQTQDCRCLRLRGGEAEIGSSPFPTATVDYYFLDKGCEKDSPRCFFKP